MNLEKYALVYLPTSRRVERDFGFLDFRVKFQVSRTWRPPPILLPLRRHENKREKKRLHHLRRWEKSSCFGNCGGGEMLRDVVQERSSRTHTHTYTVANEQTAARRGNSRTIRTQSRLYMVK